MVLESMRDGIRMSSEVWLSPTAFKQKIEIVVLSFIESASNLQELMDNLIEHS